MNRIISAENLHEPKPNEIEEWIRKYISKGIINIKAKGKGNGKAQYEAEISIIKKLVEDYVAYLHNQ